jgi:hypothetical protein
MNMEYGVTWNLHSNSLESRLMTGSWAAYRMSVHVFGLYKIYVAFTRLSFIETDNKPDFLEWQKDYGVLLNI